MSPSPRELWTEALANLRAAEMLLDVHAASAVSRAYYAAFDAVKAVLAMEGQTFSPHAGVEAAMHRDLVHTGRVPKEVGRDFSRLMVRRNVADYDLTIPGMETARLAVQQPRAVVDAMRRIAPEPLP